MHIHFLHTFLSFDEWAHRELERERNSFPSPTLREQLDNNTHGFLLFISGLLG